MVEQGLMHRNTKFFFNTHNLHTFLAIDNLEDPVYMRKISRATIGTDSQTEKIVRRMREDLGLIKQTEEDGLKKYLEYTDKGESFLAKLKNAGWSPEEAVYDDS